MAPLPRLRSTLLLLVAASLLPVVVLALVLSSTLVEREREAFHKAAQDRHRTLISALDEHVKGHLTTLKALSTSAALQSGDLAAFDEAARRVLPTQPAWQNIMVLDARGQHLVNLRLPYGSRLPQAQPSEMPLVARALADERPVIGNLARGGLTNNWGIALRMRVLPQGREPLVLQVVLDPRSVLLLLQAQGYRQTWAYGIADANSRFLARVPDAPIGTPAPPDFARERVKGDQGWYRGKTIEGRDTWTAFRTSALTGWIVGVAIPQEEVVASALRASSWILAAALGSVVLALGIAGWLGRRVSRPIALLAGEARNLGRVRDQEALAEVRRRATVQEVRDLAAALEEANAALTERELLRQREQEALRAADKAKDEFIAMLGHELRNPLSAITASAHVLRLSKPGATSATKAHEVIERQARQMTRMVEDLMDASRLAMGKVTLELEVLDLAGLVDRVAGSWQGTGRSRAGRVRTELAPAWVLGDRVRLEQVLSNLLDNAHKFSGGQGPIEVRLRADAGQAVLEVQDHGEGIEAEDLPRIFELFVQGEQSFDRPHGGIGLGLALVRRLVELQQGTVMAASAGRGRGACFTVCLPLAAEPAEGVAAPAARHASLVRRVLLVEDNEDGREALDMVLTLEGHTVRSVAAGLEAVQAAATWQPDVVLIDIGLPDIDGYEVARRIRALALVAPPRLVALSGFGQPQDQQAAYQAGFDLHLTKPVAPGFLRDVLQALASRQGVTPP